MPDESKLTIEFDHFTALDFELSFAPERWARKRPTPIALVFPHDDPGSFVQTILGSEIFLSGSACRLRTKSLEVRLLNLLLNGMLMFRGQSWEIAHPSSSVKVPLPAGSDVYIPWQRRHPDEIMLGLVNRFSQDPPSVISRFEE